MNEEIIIEGDDEEVAIEGSMPTRGGGGGGRPGGRGRGGKKKAAKKKATKKKASKKKAAKKATKPRGRGAKKTTGRGRR